MKRIMVVDDEITICRSIEGILVDEGYDVVICTSGEEAIQKVQFVYPDLVLLDIWLKGVDGIEVLKHLKGKYLELPIIIMSGHGTIETAVKATKLGAYEFIEKPISLEKLIISVENALKLHSLAKENKDLKKKMSKTIQLVGNSDFIQELKEQISVVAPTNSSVLITGENGTGKEVVAGLLHQQSSRDGKPFIAVNCAAIPEELIESELFGHEKGSFTGATRQKKGKFDYANGGTLFLDEIGDMSLKTQAKILRILQEKCFERVGGAATIETDVRIIAATNKNLEEEIKSGNFREDLYYRLNVIPFELVPLRERKGDIEVLAQHFLEVYARDQNEPIKTFSKGALELLNQYHWSGNIRELKNLIERMVIMSKADIIEIKDVPLNIKDEKYSVANIVENQVTMKEARGLFEKQFIVERLDQHDWNITKTAEAIDMERSNLHRKMKSYGIEPKKSK